MNRRVLIVDDNREFRAMLRSYLNSQKLSIDMYEASSAEMAVTKASFIKPHVTLMDLNLPNASGLVAAREILNENPQTQLIVLTMFDLDVFKKAASQVCAADFIAKTDIYDRLIPALQKCLEMAAA